MVIVNADDFGMTEGVTNGIVIAHKKGIVTHTSIMSNGLFFDEAVETAKGIKELGVGIHLVATWGKPVLSGGSTLIDKHTGLFFGYKKLIVNLLAGRINKRDVYKEWEAQIKKVVDSGIDITHIDSHHHIHMLPIFNKVVYELSDKYGVKRVRVTRERGRLGDSISLMVKKLIFFLLSIISYKAQERQFFGLSLQSAASYKEELNAIFRENYHNDIEVMVHPGIVDERLIETDMMTYSRERELQVLTDEDVVSCLKRLR